MQLSIRKRNMTWSDALAGHVERRVRQGLDRAERRVRHVLVHLVDVNGPRGGEDKKCAVSVRLTTGDEIRVQTQDTCPYRAVDSAVSRVKRNVMDRVKRTRDRRRRARG